MTAKSLRPGLLVTALLLAGACDFNITNPNLPPVIGPNATQARVASAVAGVLIGARTDMANWVLKSSIFGREGYRIDVADPRFITELLQGPLDPSNAAFGGGQWPAEYATIRSGYNILNVLSSAQLTAAEKNGVRFAVLLSSFGADKPDKSGPILGLRSFEERLNRISGLNVLALRSAHRSGRTLPVLSPSNLRPH